MEPKSDSRFHFLHVDLELELELELQSNHSLNLCKTGTGVFFIKSQEFWLANTYLVTSHNRFGWSLYPTGFFFEFHSVWADANNSRRLNPSL
jgi:hypothetical protein